jgi:DNA-binding NarL/FixJ family response regulator
MVCDSDTTARAGLVSLLSSAPAVSRVVGVGSGEEVLERWVLERPTVTVLAFDLAGMSGPETTRRLLAKHSEAATIILLPTGDVREIECALSCGAAGYLRAPVTAEALATMVGELVWAASRARHAFGWQPPESLGRGPAAPPRAGRGTGRVRPGRAS